MNEADRAARARKTAQDRARLAETRAGERRAAQDRASALAEIAKLVPVILAKLEARGWAGSELIRTKGSLGLRRQRAAWRVASRTVPYYDSTKTNYCYLLSNGKFNYGGDNCPEQSPGDIVQIEPAAILAGLRRLLTAFESQ